MATSTFLLTVLHIDETTNVVVSSKSEREDGILQEALVIRTLGRSHNMCGRSCMLSCLPVVVQ